MTYGQWVLTLVRIGWEIDLETPAADMSELHRRHIAKLKRDKRRQDMVNDARR